jgi:mannitol-specific phosphotransferase system IIBC component
LVKKKLEEIIRLLTSSFEKNRCAILVLIGFICSISISTGRLSIEQVTHLLECEILYSIPV